MVYCSQQFILFNVGSNVMRVTKNKTKNGLSFYIIRSVDGGSTEVVEKLGTEKEIVEKYHCKDAEAWARERARKLTENEKESREKILVLFRPHVLLDMDQKQSFQIGYLFLQQIYYDLKLPLICNAITKRHAFQYDMNEILSRLVYGRILFPSSKLSTYEQSSSLFEKSSFSFLFRDRGGKRITQVRQKQGESPQSHRTDGTLYGLLRSSPCNDHYKRK